MFVNNGQHINGYLYSMLFMLNVFEDHWMYVQCMSEKDQHILWSLILNSIHEKYLSYIPHDMYCVFMYVEIVSCSCFSWKLLTPPLSHLHFGVASWPAIWWGLLTVPTCMNWQDPDGGENQLNLNWMISYTWKHDYKMILHISFSCIFHNSICNLTHLDYLG